MSHQKLIHLIKNILLYGGMFLLFYSVINWWRQPIMPASPDLNLTTTDGQVVDIEALSQTSPVLVYFWGSWCGVCSVTSPKVNNFAQTSPYPVVTIAVQSGDNSELQTYMQGKGLNFTTINDANGEIFADWQGQVTPSYVVLENGKMTQGLTGIQPEWSLRLRLWIASVI